MHLPLQIHITIRSARTPPGRSSPPPENLPWGVLSQRSRSVPPALTATRLSQEAFGIERRSFPGGADSRGQTSGKQFGRRRGGEPASSGPPKQCSDQYISFRDLFPFHLFSCYLPFSFLCVPTVHCTFISPHFPSFTQFQVSFLFSSVFLPFPLSFIFRFISPLCCFHFLSPIFLCENYTKQRNANPWKVEEKNPSFGTAARAQSPSGGAQGPAGKYRPRLPEREGGAHSRTSGTGDRMPTPRPGGRWGDQASKSGAWTGRGGGLGERVTVPGGWADQ